MDKNFVDSLKSLNDIQIETHSGSYELMTQGVSRLAKVDLDNIDVSDLEMLFHFGNLRHGKAARDRNIAASNLLEEDKRYMLDCNARIAEGNYTNSGYENSHQSNGNCGLFAKGLQTLSHTNKTLNS